MGISFKLAKAGTRFRPKLSQTDEKDDGFKEKPTSRREDDQEIGLRKRDNEGDFVGVGAHIAGYSNSLAQAELRPVLQDPEVSFSLNLFPDGFSVGKPTEGLLLPLLQGVPKLLHPYDRASKALFSAIEYGWLPGDIFDDIPCKYVNGVLVCEVRDYRKCVPKPGYTVSAGERSPVIHKVHLQMSMENVVKDISSISDDFWTYNDLLEVESRVLKSLQPELRLDPTPLLDRLSRTSVSKKLNLGIFGGREERKQSNAPATATNLVPDNLSSGNISSSGVLENSKFHSHLALQDRGVPSAQQAISRGLLYTQQNNIVHGTLGQASPAVSESNYQAAVSCSGSILTAAAIPSNFVSMSEQVHTDSYAGLRNPGPLLLGKRDRSEAQSNPRPNIKRPKQEQLDLVQVQRQLPRNQVDTILELDMRWKNILLQQQPEAEKNRCARAGGLKHPQLLMNDSPQAILEGIPKLQVGKPSYLDNRGVQSSVKEEPTEIGKLYMPEMGKIKDDHRVMDIGRDQSDHQNLSPYTRAHVPSSVQWNHMGQLGDKDLRREDAIQKRRSSQSPWVSAVGIVHSPALSKSGEFPYSTSTTTVIGLQKEIATSMSAAAVGTASVNSDYDCLRRENQVSLPVKRKSNSLPKTLSMSGVGSPTSLSNMNAPFSANSPSIGTTPLPLHSGKGDPVLERFLKIEIVAQRYGLNLKKQKFDQFRERKSFSHIPQLLAFQLSKSEDTEDIKDATTDQISMSKCLFWGSLDVCKTRTLTFLRPGRVYQGNGFPIVVRESHNKLVMSDRPKDGIVELRVLCGDEEEIDPPVAFLQYSLPPLPNTHYADLFAAQFTSLMRCEGYQLVDDQIQPIPFRTIGAYSSQQPSVVTSATPGSEAAQLPPPTLIPGQSPYMSSPTGSSISALNPRQLSCQNILPGGRLLPPGNISSLQLSASYLSKPQQLDSAANLTSLQQQQHHPQIQRSSPLIGNNCDSLGSISMQAGNQMVNNPVHLQFQLQQRQRQQHQQQPLMQRNMMVGGLGAAVGMGNPSTMQPGGGVPGLGNLVDIGSMSNVVGMGGALSAPMGGHLLGPGNAGRINNNIGIQLSSFGNLSQQLLAGGMTPAAQAALLTKLRLAHSRGRGMLSGVSIRGNLVDGMGGMTGNSLMHGASMLGQAISRGGMAQLQHASMASMGPPKISATTFNMNKQMQPQPHQQLQSSPQQQQHLDHTQQMGSPLPPSQATSLSEQVGSPPTHVSPQQVSQQTPMSPQQISEQKTHMSPQQLSSGATVAQKVNAGSIVMGPGSPPLSSQTHGSVGSITSSPMDRV